MGKFEQLLENPGPGTLPVNHTLTHTLTLTLTHTQTHTLTLTQTHTHTLTHTQTHTLTHTQTHTLTLTPNLNHSFQPYPLKLFLYSLEFRRVGGGGVKSRSLISKSDFLPLLFNTGNQGGKKS